MVAFTDLFGHGIDWVNDGDNCAGAGDYSAVRDGGPGLARNEANDVIATMSFYASQSDGTECYVFFRIRDLPSAAFYSFDAGGVLSDTISFEELKQDGWEVRIIVNNDRARNPAP